MIGVQAFFKRRVTHSLGNRKCENSEWENYETIFNHNYGRNMNFGS